MKAAVWMSMVSVGVLLSGSAMAQAPAGAPAGANGMCKDGTYSMSAKKEGACRGHKGVQTWFVAGGAASSAAKPMAAAPRPTPAPMAAAPKPTPAPMAAAPAPTPTTVHTSGTAKRMSPTAAAAARTQAPGGGPGMVWVNSSTKVYHCPGSDFYGKTKEGSYMSEADAKAKGDRPDHNKACKQ